MRPLAFKPVPWEFFENSGILSKKVKKSQLRYLEKGVLNLCRAATIKPRKEERNRQTQFYRLDWGSAEVWFQKNRDFLSEDDYYAPPPLWDN